VVINFIRSRGRRNKWQ